MRILDEALTSSLISTTMALDAAREAFLAASDGAVNPVVLGPGTVEGSRFSLKSGRSGDAVGVKIGAYWPSADALGLPRHSSTTILLDPVTGRVSAVVEAARANGFRTAAADALATLTLARSDSTRLAVFGAGHQARFQIQALLELGRVGTAQGPLFTHVDVVGRTPAKAAALAQWARDEYGITASGVDLGDVDAVEAAVRRADSVTTATNATAPLLQADWIEPGTHVSAMGADGSGKNELPVDLYERAGVRMFADLVEQSLRIGEFSNAATIAAREAMGLGEVLRGAVGRSSDEEITVFDSSGFALQDLMLAQALLAAAQ